MARRRKQQTPRDITLPANWKAPAILTIVLAFITFVVLPSVTNPILKLFTLILKPIGFVLIAFFGLMAIFIFFGQKASNPKSSALQHHKDSNPASRPDIPNAPTGILNTDWDASLSRNLESRLQERP